MAPNFTKYPIAMNIFPCISPSSRKQSLPCSSLPSDSSMSLVRLLNKPIDNYLKKVNHYLKDLYEGLPNIIVSMEWTFGFSAPETYTVTPIKITITQVAKQQSTILEALRFLTLGFLHSQGLLMKVALLCQTSEIDAAELGKLTKVKEKLVLFSGLLDGILMAYYFIEDTSNLPKVDDVKRMAKKLRKTIRNINPRNIPQLIPNSVVAEEDILCSFLGLHRDVADRLRSVNPVMRSHQTDLYFLQHFLDDSVAYSEANESLTEREAVPSKLQQMGFTQSRSVVIANWIAKQPSAEHWSHLAWARHYIENLFTYDIFLNDDVCRYPYEEGNVNEWFSVSVERDGDEDVVVETEVPVINTTYPEASKFISEKIEQNQQYPRKCIYFHGTDHMSAKSILEDGINLGMGKSGCDFSSGAGFYLVDCSKYATEWALKSSAAAVLMFCVSEDSLSDYKALDLLNEREKCKEVREHYRNNEKLSSSVRKECRDCDYIKGPVNSTPRVIQQICIKKEGMAVSIGNAANICAVIFMDRQIENNFKP